MATTYAVIDPRKLAKSGLNPAYTSYLYRPAVLSETGEGKTIFPDPTAIYGTLLYRQILGDTAGAEEIYGDINDIAGLQAELKAIEDNIQNKNQPREWNVNDVDDALRKDWLKKRIDEIEQTGADTTGNYSMEDLQSGSKKRIDPSTNIQQRKKEWGEKIKSEALALKGTPEHQKLFMNTGGFEAYSKASLFNKTGYLDDYMRVSGARDASVLKDINDDPRIRDLQQNQSKYTDEQKLQIANEVIQDVQGKNELHYEETGERNFASATDYEAAQLLSPKDFFPQLGIKLENPQLLEQNSNLDYLLDDGGLDNSNLDHLLEEDANLNTPLQNESVVNQLPTFEGTGLTYEQAMNQYDQTFGNPNPYQGTNNQIITNQQQEMATTQGADKIQKALQSPQVKQLYEALKSGNSWVNGKPLSNIQRQNVQQQLDNYLKSYGLTSDQLIGGGQAGQTSTGGQAGSSVMGGDYNTQAALDVINNSSIDEGQKSFFREVIQAWDPNSEINIPNVLKTFGEIKDTTISPYFREQAKIFTDQFTRDRDFMEQQRKQEEEALGAQEEQQISGVQNQLGASGMWMSGQSTELLGEQGTYAKPGTPEAMVSAIPLQTAGKDGKFAEGTVMQNQRAAASSTAARYQKNLEEMARRAEQALGSQASAGLVPGVKQLGDIKGSLAREKTQAEASALTGVYNQELQNYEARKPMEVFKN